MTNSSLKTTPNKEKVETKNAFVLGSLTAIGGAIKVGVVCRVDSTPVPLIEKTLSKDPLWNITTGDPFLLELIGVLPGYDFGKKVVARKPLKADILNIPPGTLAIITLDEVYEENGRSSRKIAWKCVYIHRIKNSFPYLDYSALGSSGVYSIMMPDSYRVEGLIFPYQCPE